MDYKPSAGGVRARLRRMAGYESPTISAGHAPGGAQTDHELTFNPHDLMGADHNACQLKFKTDSMGFE